MVHDDDREFEMLARTLREVHAPPPPPREEMWARIQAQRAAGRTGIEHAAGGANNGAAAGASVVVLPLRTRRRAYVQWGAALAAMLVLGIGLGRFSMQQATTSSPPAQATLPPSPGGASADVAGPYRLAATQHLQRTETLLTSLTVDGAATDAREVTGWARELLTDTRLLLASPVSQDPAIQRLLEDLELLLAQIATIPSARANEEVELIQDGLNQSDVLLRLRAATAVRRTVGT